MSGLLRVPDAVIDIVVRFLTKVDVGALQRAHRRFRKSFMVAKTIRTLEYIITIFCKMVVPLEPGVDIADGKGKKMHKIMGRIERVDILFGGSERFRFGQTMITKSLAFNYHHVDMLCHVTESLRELRVITGYVSPQLLPRRPRQSLPELMLGAIRKAKFLKTLALVGMHGNVDAIVEHVHECHHLSTLKLWYGPVPELYGSPPRNLNGCQLPLGLKKLVLTRCNISDVSGLCELPLLEHLSLENTKITDTSTVGGTCEALARAPRLIWLDLTLCCISKIAPLAAHYWQHLSLFGTDVKNVEALQKTRICELRMNAPKGLETLKNVHELSITASNEKLELSDGKYCTLHVVRGELRVAELAHARELKILSLDRTRIRGSGFAGLVNLRLLMLRGTTGLCLFWMNFPESLKELGLVDFEERVQKDIGDGLKNLERLAIRDCRNWTGVVKLDSLPKLRALKLDGSPHLVARGQAASRFTR
jgi:hypothetical protein